MTVAAGRGTRNGDAAPAPDASPLLVGAAVAVAVVLLVVSAAWLLPSLGPSEEAGPPPRTHLPASLASPHATQRSQVRIALRVGALTARRMESVLLAGRLEGEPDTALRVQHLESPGRWTDFPLPAVTDEAGRFQTYVELNRRGPHKVRVVDPASGAVSVAFVIEVR